MLFDNVLSVVCLLFLTVQRDSSATDTEDETPQGRKKKKDKAKQHRTKGRREKRENNKALFKSKVRLIKAHNKDRLKEKELKKAELTPLVINKKVCNCMLRIMKLYHHTWKILHIVMQLLSIYISIYYFTTSTFFIISHF